MAYGLKAFSCNPLSVHELSYTLVHCANTADNLNRWSSNNAKVSPMHYFITVLMMRHATKTGVSGEPSQMSDRCRRSGWVRFTVKWFRDIVFALFQQVLAGKNNYNRPGGRVVVQKCVYRSKLGATHAVLKKKFNYSFQETFATDLFALLPLWRIWRHSDVTRTLMVLILVDMNREDQDLYIDTKYCIIWPVL